MWQKSFNDTFGFKIQDSLFSTGYIIIPNIAEHSSYYVIGQTALQTYVFIFPWWLMKLPNTTELKDRLCLAIYVK